MEMVTVAEISRRTSFHRRTIRQWLKDTKVTVYVTKYREDGIPILAYYDYEEVIQAFCKKLTDKVNTLQEIDYICRKWKVPGAVVCELCDNLGIEVYKVFEKGRNRRKIRVYDTRTIEDVLFTMQENRRLGDRK